MSYDTCTYVEEINSSNPPMAARKCFPWYVFSMLQSEFKKTLGSSFTFLVTVGLAFLNPFYPNVPFLYPLKTSENLMF